MPTCCNDLPSVRALVLRCSGHHCGPKSASEIWYGFNQLLVVLISFSSVSSAINNNHCHTIGLGRFVACVLLDMPAAKYEVRGKKLNATKSAQMLHGCFMQLAWSSQLQLSVMVTVVGDIII